MNEPTHTHTHAHTERHVCMNEPTHTHACSLTHSPPFSPSLSAHTAALGLEMHYGYQLYNVSVFVMLVNGTVKNGKFYVCFA